MDTTLLTLIPIGLLILLAVVILFVLRRALGVRKRWFSGVSLVGAHPLDAAQQAPSIQLLAMRRSIRSWAWFQIVFGVIALFGGQFLSSPWGIIQILIGLVSFYFHSDYPMFMVYAGSFVWAALMNIASGSGTWIGAGLLQLYWAYLNFRRFNIYQAATRAEHAAAAAPDPMTDPAGPPPVWGNTAPQENTRAQKLFPWLALVLGLGGALAFVASFIGLFIAGALRLFSSVPPLISLLINVSLLLSIMGVPFAIASLRSGYTRKPASIVGLIFGLLMLVAYLWLSRRTQ